MVGEKMVGVQDSTEEGEEGEEDGGTLCAFGIRTATATAAATITSPVWHLLIVVVIRITVIKV